MYRDELTRRQKLISVGILWKGAYWNKLFLAEETMGPSGWTFVLPGDDIDPRLRNSAGLRYLAGLDLSLDSEKFVPPCVVHVVWDTVKRGVAFGPTRFPVNSREANELLAGYLEVCARVPRFLADHVPDLMGVTRRSLSTPVEQAKLLRDYVLYLSEHVYTLGAGVLDGNPADWSKDLSSLLLWRESLQDGGENG